MELSDLQNKLSEKVAKSCGDAPDPATLTMHLERARFEYSLHQPFMAVHEFSLAAGAMTVTIDPDPGHVVMVEGVYIAHYSPPDPFAWTPHLDHEAYPGGYPPPNWHYIDVSYADRYERYQYPVSYLRNNETVTLQLPRRLREGVSGAIIYGRTREWTEVPDFHEGLILDRALADYIDRLLVGGKAGLVRVPTPNGSFEFDGGHNLRLLRDRLIEDFENRLSLRTPIITHG